jgi:hypothetical protein
MPTRGKRWITACLLACACLGGGCGNDPPAARPHGLEATTLKNEPTGAPITVTFGLAPGARWTGDLNLEVSEESVTRTAGRTRPSSRDVQMSLSIEEVALGEPVGQRETRITYRQGQSTDPEANTDTGPGVSTVRFQVDAQGSVVKDSVLVTGAHLPGTRSLLDSMLLAGIASSASWIPNRPVRVGEAWEASEVVESGEVRRLLKLDSQRGVKMPKPVQTGRVRVEGLRDLAGRPTLDLRIDVLVSASGTMADGTNTGDMSLGWHLEGTCSVDVQTGLPVAVALEAQNVVEVRTGGDRYENRKGLTLVGTLGPGE